MNLFTCRKICVVYYIAFVRFQFWSEIPTVMASITSIILTKAASGATAANLLSLFRGRKLIKLLTMGYALPEMPLSVS